MSKCTGKKIRQYRLEKGLTQKELGDKCGIADSAIRRYESGKITPKNEILYRIAVALDVSILNLMDVFPEWEKLAELQGEVQKESTEYLQRLLDVVKDRIFFNDRNDIFTHLPEEDLLYYFWSLNKDGQEKVVEYATDLSQNPRYKK